MQPRISVIIPYYKGEKYIAEALESVFNQQYQSLEVIIVNDGSPIETLEVLQPFSDRVKIIHQENQGQAAARNTGIRVAVGEILTFLDQDDLWTQNHLNVMLPFLVENNQFDFVRGATQKFSMAEPGEKIFQEPVFQEVLMGSALYRKSVFDRVGLLDPHMHEGEDFDWALRLRESGCIEKRISETTLYYRIHETNHSKKEDFIKNGQMLSIKKKLERMRAQQP